MSILDVPPPNVPLSVIIAEHPRRLIRHFEKPGRLFLITFRPSRRFRIAFLAGDTAAVAPVVTFDF